MAFTRSPTVLEMGRSVKMHVSSREGSGMWKRGRPPDVMVTEAPTELPPEDATEAMAEA